MIAFWNFVTDFGDTAVTLPLSALMIAFLCLSNQRRPALMLAVGVAGCLAFTGLAKLALQSCGHPLLSADVTNPSGHAALSAMTYGSLGLLLGCGVAAERRWMISAGSALLIGSIVVSRIVLAFHSPAEVGIGLMIGVAAFLAFRWALGRTRGIELHGPWLAIAALLVLATLHGSRWPAEQMIQYLVHLIRHSVPGCA